MKTGSPTLPAFIHTTVTALAVLLALTSLHAQAIGRLAQVTIVNPNTGARLPMYYAKGQYWVAGRPGAQYAVTLHNRSGDRVNVVLMVDGVDVLTGQTDEFTGQNDGWRRSGYVFLPHARDRIAGWYKSSGTLPYFEFANVANSHADLTARSTKVGLIQIALFRQRIIDPVAQVRPEPSGQRRNKVSNEDRLSEEAPHGQRQTPVVSHLLEEVISIRYDSRKNLIAKGVIRKRRAHPPVPQTVPQSDSVFYVPDPR
ncbi:MAG: hypothetical protein V4843_05870 [Pseudomonadota bacterium]